jgi:phage shock protein PspC (stress-responsive transcriptional regulator)
MNKVVTINLSGQAYQLEEGGYDALRRYLDNAEAKLAENPDKTEIMSDVESAIAQKCSAFLTPQKQVVSTSEIEEIIKEMGPVQNAGEEKSESSEKDPAPKLKRFYRIREGSMIGGICNGIAAYFEIDPTIVRIIFVLILIFTSGGFAAVYLILMFIIPAADTPKQRAEAFGAAPFTAQQLVDRAQEGYENLKNSKEVREWRKNLREQKKAWKQQYRYNHRAYAERWQHANRSPFWEFLQSIMGMAWLAFFAFAFWWGFHHIPAVHDLLIIISNWLSSLVAKISS